MDKYDTEIKRLRAINSPIALHESWNKFGPLFQTCGTTFSTVGHLKTCGCLTQIRHKGEHYAAAQSNLTEMIKKDDRIPQSPIEPFDIDYDENEIQKRFQAIMDNLEVFAEWQRTIDKELKRT